MTEKTYYNYIVQTDIASATVNIDQLETYIRRFVELDAGLIGISLDAAKVNLAIIYSSELDNNSKAILDSIVHDHVAIVPEIFDKEIHCNITRYIVHWTPSYTSFGHFLYEGTINDRPIQKIKIHLSLNGSISNIGIRIIDLTHALIISENSSFTLNSNEIYVLDVLNNLPALSSYFDLQIKINHTKNNDIVNIKSARIFF